MELLAFPFVRLTGLFDCFPSVSDSDGSDAFDGLKIAKITKKKKNSVRIREKLHVYSIEFYLLSALIYEYLMSELRASNRGLNPSCLDLLIDPILMLMPNFLIAFWPVFVRPAFSF